MVADVILIRLIRAPGISCALAADLKFKISDLKFEISDLKFEISYFKFET